MGAEIAILFEEQQELARSRLQLDADAAAITREAAAARLARYDALLQMPRAEDLDELLDDEEEELGGEDFDEDDEEEEKGGDDDDDGRFDDPEPEAATTTPKA